MKVKDLILELDKYNSDKEIFFRSDYPYQTYEEVNIYENNNEQIIISYIAKDDV